MVELNDPIIRMEDVCRVFYTDEIETHALSGISLTLAKGDYLAVEGPSGSGKSTFLNLLGLLDAPSSGRYWLDGIETSELGVVDQTQIRNKKIGFVFQSFNLIGSLSALENVLLPLSYRRDFSSSDSNNVALEALERVGMTHRANHFPAQLSGGQQQRIAIARAICGKPSILLADDPTGNLDSENSREVMQIVDDLHQEGATICMVTHDSKFAERANRTIRIVDGKLAS